MAKKNKAAAVPAQSEGAAQEGRKTLPLWERPWFPLVLFALLSLVYFHEFPLSGKVIFGQDVGTDYHRGKDGVGEKLAELVQPMWDAQLGGYPHSEEIRHQYFPLRLFYLFTTYQRYIGWRYIATVFFAGWAMFLFLRGLGLSRAAALWAGAAYMTAPAFLSFPYAGHYAKMAVAASFPLMCYWLDRGLETRRLGYFAGIALLIAAGVYSPHVQMLYYALWGLGFYFLFRLVEAYRAGEARPALARRVGLFSLAVVLGLGLGAEGLLPATLYTRSESKRAAGKEEAGAAERQLAFSRSWSLHPEEVVSLIVPEFGGFFDPVEGRNYYWGRNPMKLNSEHIGIWVMLLALLAVPLVRRGGVPLFMGLLFLFGLTYALGPHTPVHWLFYHLAPGAKVLRTPGMIAFLCSFAACTLAALTLDRMRLATAAEIEIWWRRLGGVAAVIGVLCLFVAVAPAAATDAWIALFYDDISPQKRQILRGGYDWLGRGALLALVSLMAGTALLWGVLRRKVGFGLALLVIGAMTVGMNWRIDRSFLHYEDPARYSDKRQENRRTVAFMEKGGRSRVFPLPGYALLKEPGYHLHGIPAVSAFHDFTLRRYDRLTRELDPVLGAFQARYQRGAEVPYSDEQLLGAIQPLLNLVNARYIAVPREMRLQTQRFPEVFAEEKIRLYENPSAFPWVYLAPDYRVAGSEEEALSWVRDGKMDVKAKAVVEKEPPFAPDGGDTTADRVEEVAYDRRDGHIAFRVHSGGDRLLVLSENYYANWKVFVDGEERLLRRVNYLWMGVHVPPGQCDVEFRYNSSIVDLSRLLSGASLLVLGAIAVWEWRRRRGAIQGTALPG
jgi:hypothetical protein